MTRERIGADKALATLTGDDTFLGWRTALPPVRVDSNIDVPATVKELVKASQEQKCWLCNRKAHKRNRPLEICHIFPQAMSKRYNVNCFIPAPSV